MTSVTPDRSSAVLSTSAVFLGIATIFIVLRCISKFGIRRRADVDDWVTILAYLFTVALSVAIIFASTVGMGKSDNAILPQWQKPLKEATYVFPIFYHLSNMAAKTAVLLLYIRMASAHLFLRYASYGVLAVVNLSSTVLIFLNIFQCRPISAAWTPNTQGKCMDIVTLFLAESPINILSDLAILCLPLPIITSLRIEFQAKVGLVVTFICLIFVAVVDIVRISFLQTALKEQILLGRTTVTATRQPDNYYYYVSYGLLWSAIECSVRVSCACALVLKPLLQKLNPAAFIRNASDTSRSRNRTKPDSHEVDAHYNAHVQGSSGDAASPGQDCFSSDIWGQDVSAMSNPSYSPKAAKTTMPLQAILETDPTVPEEDTMDILQLFRAGPSSPPLETNYQGGSTIAAAMSAASGTALFGAGMAPRSSFVYGPSSPPIGGSSFSRDGAPRPESGELNGTTGESPHSSDTMTPLTVVPSRQSRRFSALSKPVRWITKESIPPEHSQQPTQKFFDFVQMGGRKSLNDLTNREAWWPVLFVSILFFLWGFSYGMLGSLNSKILEITNRTQGKAIALQNSYWLGYIFGPLTFGAYTLLKHGFKTTFMTGLVIYAVGCMTWWPSSVLASYGGFIVANFIIAIGLSTLEVAANPFIALAGPSELAEARLNFAQGIQAMASIFSPILASKALFRNLEGRLSLFDVQWCYLAIALFVIFLALVFFYVPLSETDDNELQRATDSLLDAAGLNVNSKAYGRFSARWYIAIMGPIMMAFYVGSQEAVSYFWGDLMSVVRPHDDALWNLTIGHALFCISRFLASGVLYFGIKPRFVLNICLTGTFLCGLLAAVLPSPSGAYVCMLLVLFFEGPVFPTLFVQALRGQGRHIKLVSIALTSSIGGAVVWESVTYAVFRYTHDPRKAWIVPTVLFGVQWLFPMTLDCSSTLRRWVDPQWDTCKPPLAKILSRRGKASRETTVEKLVRPQPEPGEGIDGVNFGKQPALCRTELATVSS